MNVTALEKLGFADDEVVKDWHKNKDVYADEAEDKVVNDFLVKRKANVITKNKLQVEDIDTVRSQILEQATQKLIAAYQKKTFQSKSTFDFTTISSGGMNKLLNESVLFSVGYFTLVKSLISDDKTRKIFWKEVRKEIAYNVLIDAKNKLMDLKTVEHHAFYALPGLLGLFKKYGGKL